MAVPPQPPGSGMPGQPPFGQQPQHPAPQGMPGGPPPGQYPQQPGAQHPSAQYPGGAYPQQPYPQQGPGAPQQPQYGTPGYPQGFPQQPYQGQPQAGAYPQGAQYPAAPYGAPQMPGGQVPGGQTPVAQYPGGQYPAGQQFPNPAAYQGGYGAPQQQYPQQPYQQPGAPAHGQAPYAPAPPQYGQPQYGAYPPPQPPAQPPPFRGATQAVPGQQMPGQQYPGAPQYPGAAMPRAPQQGMPQQPAPPQSPPGGRAPQAPWAGGTYAAPGLPPAAAPANRAVPQSPGQPPVGQQSAAPQPPRPQPGAPAQPQARNPAQPIPAPIPQKAPAAVTGAAPARPQPIPAPAAKSPAPGGAGPTIGLPAAAGSPASVAAAARAAEAVAGPGVRQAPPNPDDEIEDPVELLKRNAIPLLVSFVVHLMLIIALGLMVNQTIKTNTFTLDASFDSPGDESLAEIRSLAEATEALEMPDQKPLASLPQLPNPIKVPVSPLGAGPAAVVVPPSSILPAAMAGRGITGGMKQSLVNAKGGSKQTENAVDLGLQWLAFHQLPTGMWSLTGEAPVGKGKYSKGAKSENNEAATAMALLAFFGAGHTPGSGSPHAKVIDNAVKALLRSQDAKGNFFQGKKMDEWMYSHALCTMAMCEYLALEPTNTSLKAPCEKAVRFCIESQHDLGGWRYSPRGDSDTSVTGWMLMALQSAKNAKIKVPQETFDKISSYLDKAAKGLDSIDMRASTVVMATKDMEKLKADVGSRYSYQPGMDYDHVMTAEGLLCRMYLGWAHGDARLKNGCEYLLTEHLPTWEQRDVYYWYYGTQAMFHMEGEYWNKWNNTLRDMLVANQEQSGPERGSWNPLGGGPRQEEGADLWSMNNAGGRLYVTCFSLYMLEVYYRHLPLYSELKKQMEARSTQ